MGPEVVEQDDVAGVEFGEHYVSEIGQEDLGICTAFDGHDGGEAPRGERTDHGRHRAPVAGNHDFDPFALWSPGLVSGHGDVRAGFIDTEQLGGVYPLLPLLEACSEALNAVLVLFLGWEGLFFSGPVARLYGLLDRRPAHLQPVSLLERPSYLLHGHVRSLAKKRFDELPLCIPDQGLGTSAGRERNR